MSNPTPPSRFLGSFVARAILLVMALALLLLSERWLCAQTRGGRLRPAGGS